MPFTGPKQGLLESLQPPPRQPWWRPRPLPQLAGDGETGGVWMSWFVEPPAAVDAAHASALEHGLTVTQPPTDEPWGVREFHLRHPDGHTFRVSADYGEGAAG